MIEIIGEEKLAASLAGIVDRAGNLRPVFDLAIERQEQYEETLFESGKYVRTGALRDSLTNSNAEGAIRNVRAMSVEFGTSIWYGRFQVENPGPVTPAGGLTRKGHKSAVLKRAPAAAVEVTEAVGEYVMGYERFVA